VHDCSSLNGVEDCIESDYANDNYITKSLLEICEAFNSKTHCLAEYKLTKAKNNVTDMAQKYKSRFASEKLDSLFKLRPEHLKFYCKNDIHSSQKTLNIPIFAAGIDAYKLQYLLDIAELKWNSSRLKVKFTLLEKKTDEAIQIISIADGISHVPDDDTHLIYLNSSLPADQAASVFAHEFGHVLGFPDCYIEFFDRSKKELVYYEIAEKNMNIMCSMKYGVAVPDDYFVQLEQSSCNFR
jgi:hypothetical protein